MITATVTTRCLNATDSLAYRELRLESLQDSPDCFATTYAAQAKLPQLFFEGKLQACDQDHRVVGAYDEADLVGICALIIQRQSPTPSGELLQMFVRKDYRGAGVGASLLAAVIDLAQTQYRLKSLNLQVTPNNGKALKFYTRMGFVEQKNGNDADQDISMILNL